MRDKERGVLGVENTVLLEKAEQLHINLYFYFIYFTIV